MSLVTLLRNMSIVSAEKLALICASMVMISQGTLKLFEFVQNWWEMCQYAYTKRKQFKEFKSVLLSEIMQPISDCTDVCHNGLILN